MRGQLMDIPEQNLTKIGVNVGDGPPPGYEWNVEIFDQAYDEARKFLDDAQYGHLAAQVRELAGQSDPTHSDTVDVRPIEDFHEIRDKGGLLRNINARVFFFVFKPTRSIIVLGAIKKENDGPTPTGDRLRMRRRQRLYMSRFDESSQPSR